MISRLSKLTKAKNQSLKALFSTSAKPTLLGESLLSELQSSNTVREEYDTVIVGFSDIYGRLLGKRYDVDYFLSSGYTGSKACDYTMAVDMPMNPLEGFKFASWSQGFGDLHLKPDVHSLRPAAWLDKTLLILCDVCNSNGDLVPIAPRSILKNSLEKLDSLGSPVTVNAATELEYYLYETSYEEANELGYEYSKLKPAGYYSEDYHILQGTRNESYTQAARRALTASGLTVETSKGETGIGQHELNLKYNNALSMADEHIFFKQCLKEVAMGQNRSITFMAKPTHEDAGNSCHIHLSLFNQEGKNMFLKENSQSEPPLNIDNLAASETFYYFLGGWMKSVLPLSPFFLPTINSYKRLQAGSWAPTATAWAMDNRTVPFRVVDPSSKGLRIEFRLPGADVNPYLALAASIAAGTRGLKDKILPPEILDGDGYTESTGQGFPSSLRESVSLFENNPWIKEMFGEDVQEHYSRFYKLEQEAYDSVVTDFERKRYFEQI
eukprot:snap_masked-scaffold_40-processed-gene-2.21-mRNA-1 protein AED:0.02 eAED:0.03 QI:0/-1/0/1/-1/1/1/0/495